MSSQQHTGPGTSAVADLLVFALAAAALFAAVGYYFYVDYAQEDETYQLLGLFGGIAVAMLIAHQSSYGRRLWTFMTESRLELRKIVWPPRHSALVNSGLVFVLVFVAGVYFWSLDTLFRWAVWSLLGFE